MNIFDPGRWRSAISALAGLLLLSLGTAQAAEKLDLKTVPQMPGATGHIVLDQTIIYVSPESVDATGRKLREILYADGWHLFDYGERYESQTEDRLNQQDFVKGPHAIAVHVVTAPAMNNATSVQYSTYPVAEPMPLPKDAKKVAFTPSKAFITCETAESAEAIFEFYKSGLKELGWMRFTPPQADAPVEQGKTLRAHFIKENTNPIHLIVHPEEPGRTIIHISPESHEAMMATYAPKPPPAAPTAPQELRAPTPPASDADEQNDEDSDDKFADMVQGLVRDALKPVEKKPKAAAETANGEPLRAMSIQVAPVPIPEDASNIEYQSEYGSLSYDSPSSVADIAAFLRKEMKAAGFKEKKTPINRENMAVLNFQKAKKQDVNLTLMRMGDSTNVTANGRALKTADTPPSTAQPVAVPGFQPPPPAPASEPAATAVGDEAPAPDAATAETTKEVALAELEVADQGGLPVPKPYSSAGRTKSKFLYAANASVSASVETVAQFYRQELGKRGWKEDESAAKLEKDKGSLIFTAPEGPAKLEIGKQGGETTVTLTVREKAKAEASGLMPKPGAAKIIFGSILEEPSQVTINGKTFKVAPGETADDPKKSPQIELPPGTHKVSVKVKGKSSPAEDVVVSADEIWGVLVGPGGVLPLQMY